MLAMSVPIKIGSCGTTTAGSWAGDFGEWDASSSRSKLLVEGESRRSLEVGAQTGPPPRM